MKIGLLQLNYTVGDFQFNIERIRAAVQKAADAGAQLCVGSELAIWGYPARDLLLNPGLVDAAWQMTHALAKDLEGLPPTIIGIAEPNPQPEGKPLFNSAVLLHNGKIERTFRKSLLPTYDVFDEARYFEPGTNNEVWEFAGQRIGVTVCEDAWNDQDVEHNQRYATDPIEKLSLDAPDLIINLSGSPFVLGKHDKRTEIFRGIAGKYKVPCVFVNQVGGHDDLIFDGRSMVIGANGHLIAQAAAFEEETLVVDTQQEAQAQEQLQPEEEAWKALVLGVRDYARKTGFQKALLGLSGGIDSALTAAIAVDALGPENVTGVLMPSPYSSQHSLDDAYELGKLLGMPTKTIPIAGLMGSFDEALNEHFDGYSADTTEENIQSRIRGNLLMAMSNKYRSLLLTTGNKSELSVGYCTIYGDMSGGLAVISDLPKTLVFKICRWVNQANGPTIPQNTIDKPPSAELRPDQKVTDSLPDYDVLDDMLERYVEKHQTKQDLIEAGFKKDEVERVTRLLKIAEFKRRQAAPGLKITDRAFGTGWRMPIASKIFAGTPKS